MKKELKNLINMQYTDVTNCMHKIGDYDMPQVYCPKVKIDYLALYTETGLYHKTKQTAVTFFQYDNVFDGLYGLWNAIYYNNPRLLTKFIKKFNGVRYMVAPDYSHTEDMDKFENYYRYAKARIVSGWLTLVLGIIVIPLITYSSREDFELMLLGLEETEMVCVSTKGIADDPNARCKLQDAIKYTVDNLKNLKSIVVYSVSKDENILDIFEYANNKGIGIVIPQNTLRERNLNKEVNNGKI